MSTNQHPFMADRSSRRSEIWGSLGVTSALTFYLALSTYAFVTIRPTADEHHLRLWLFVLIVGLLPGAALFSVRGFYAAKPTPLRFLLLRSCRRVVAWVVWILTLGLGVAAGLILTDDERVKVAASALVVALMVCASSGSLTDRRLAEIERARLAAHIDERIALDSATTHSEVEELRRQLEDMKGRVQRLEATTPAPHRGIISRLLRPAGRTS